MTAARTPIGLIRDHVEAWRRDNRWSRETAAEAIVAAHERLGFDRLTGIHFDPPTRDAFERMRVNADRVFRWLDDGSKDRNLLPINFLWSILAALPAGRRVALAEALLRPVELDAVLADPAAARPAAGDPVAHHFREVVSAAAAAEVDLSRMLDGIDPGEPEAAQGTLARAVAALQSALGCMHRFVTRPLPARHVAPRRPPADGGSHGLH